jgi:hypothetical protein
MRVHEVAGNVCQALLCGNDDLHPAFKRILLVGPARYWPPHHRHANCTLVS